MDIPLSLSLFSVGSRLQRGQRTDFSGDINHSPQVGAPLGFGRGHSPGGGVGGGMNLEAGGAYFMFGFFCDFI